MLIKNYIKKLNQNKANGILKCSHQRSMILWHSYFFRKFTLCTKLCSLDKVKPKVKYCLRLANKLPPQSFKNVSF